jgi:predicted ATPase/DNA-binding SARP family transcriptional activator
MLRPVQFRDLGPLQVEVDGAPRALGGLKPITVLSLLLVNANRRVSVDSLVDALWGSAASPRAAGTLESHVWRLRRMLEPDRPSGAGWTVVVNDTGGYRLVAEPDDVDSLRFERMAAAVRDLSVTDDPHQVVSMCSSALALWRDRPYELFADHDWAVSLVARLNELLVEVQERRVDALLALGENDRALHDVAGLIEEMPFRERLWAQRMLALYRTGRNEEALSSYQRARALLLDELGLEPGPQLRELQSRILAQDLELQAPGVTARTAAPPSSVAGARPSASAPASEAAPVPRPAPVRLPARGGRLIGRATELAHVVALVRAHPVVTITGAAGCGKTRLSVEVAAGLADAFGDGVWFVDLASVADPTLVVDVVSSVIGFAAAGESTGLHALTDYLRDRRTLLVLDNAEHLLDAVAVLVEAVLASGSPTTLLTTSREPLGVDGEVLWPLRPLAVSVDREPHPHPHPVPDAPATGDAVAPAVELFVERVVGANPSVVLDADDMAVVTRICAAVDGLPLAIELAAARIRSATLNEIADGVTADVGALRRLGRASHDHRAGVRAAVDWSHRLLTEPERIVHRRLAVLPGAFVRSAAVTVAGVEPVPAADVPDLLALLVHRSLLESAPAARPGGPTLYRQLSTVRNHAAGHLDAAGETASTQDRRDTWVERLLAQRPRLSRASDGWYDRADDAYATIRATLHRRLVEQPTPAAGRLLSGLAMFWYYRNRMVEARRWLEAGLRVPGLEVRHAVDIHLTLVGHGLLGGRPDIVPQHLTAALCALDDLDGDDLVQVAELMAADALAAEARGAQDVYATLADGVRQAERRTTSPVLTMLVEGLDLLGSAPAGTTTHRHDELYRRALEDGNVLAAWIAATVGTAATSDAATAIHWTDQQARSQVRLGSVDGGVLAERRAASLLAADRTADAVRLFAAARTYNRRAGLPWPLLPDTDGCLDEARRTLGSRPFDAAWEEGARLHVTQLMPDSAPPRVDRY